MHHQAPEAPGFGILKQLQPRRNPRKRQLPALFTQPGPLARFLASKWLGFPAGFGAGNGVSARLADVASIFANNFLQRLTRRERGSASASIAWRRNCARQARSL